MLDERPILRAKNVRGRAKTSTPALARARLESPSYRNEGNLFDKYSCFGYLAAWVPGVVRVGVAERRVMTVRD